MACNARRAVTLVLALTATLLLAACGGKDPKAASVAGSFVGKPTGIPNALFSLSADPASNATAAREIRAYLCDGRTAIEWFRGPAAGNSVALTADDGARLEATLAPATASGKVTLPDGRVATFAATPASGIDGMYTVTGGADNTLSGTSERGGKMVATVGTRGSGKAGPDEFPIAGTFTAPDGKSEQFTNVLSDFRPAELQQSPAIVIVANGKKIGGPKARPATAKPGGGVSFSWPELD